MPPKSEPFSDFRSSLTVRVLPYEDLMKRHIEELRAEELRNQKLYAAYHIDPDCFSCQGSGFEYNILVDPFPCEYCAANYSDSVTNIGHDSALMMDDIEYS